MMLGEEEEGGQREFPTDFVQWNHSHSKYDHL